MRKILFISFLLFSFQAFAQISKEENLKVKNKRSPADQIFTYVEEDDGAKITTHLKEYPESVWNMEYCWYALHSALWGKHEKAARSIMQFLFDTHQLDQQLYKEGPENMPECEGSPYSMNANLAERIVNELELKH